jgi:hypothetical protein
LECGGIVRNRLQVANGSFRVRPGPLSHGKSGGQRIC